MSAHIGVPGIGGSLGECQVCGENFMMEILMGKKVATFELDNCLDQVLYAHKGCVGVVKDGMNPESLPEKSPLRKAFATAEKEQS